MNSVANAINKNQTVNGVGHQYNWQHLVFVTKYRYKMFGKQKTIDIIRRAFYAVAERYKITIKELLFGEDYAHTHRAVFIPNTMSVSFAVQLLKGFSSHEVFREIPNHRLRYPRGNFWSAGYSNGSVGPSDETIVKNYIRRQDIFRSGATCSMIPRPLSRGEGHFLSQYLSI